MNIRSADVSSEFERETMPSCVAERILGSQSRPTPRSQTILVLPRLWLQSLNPAAVIPLHFESHITSHANAT